MAEGFKWAALGLAVLGAGLAIAGCFFPPLELAAGASFEAALAASAGTAFVAADASLAIGVGLDLAVAQVHPSPANQAVVVGDLVGLALGYGIGKAIGAGVSKFGPAVVDAFSQRAAQKAAQEIPEELLPPNYSIVSRVQGGVMPNASRFRIGIGEEGEMIVNGRQMLHVTFDEAEHTAYFLAKRGPEAEIISFQVETEFVDQVRAAAVPQAQARAFPGSPQIDDPTVTTGAYGLPKEWIDKMINASVKGSGKITK